MPTVPILMPQLGESIAEATVVQMHVKVGDEVWADQEVIEVETNKAVMSVTTLCNGIVAEIRATEGESYAVGSILGLLEVTEEEVTRTGVDTMESLEAKRSMPSQSAAASDSKESNLHFAVDGDDYEEAPAVVPSVKGLPVPTGTMGAHYISPRMRARMDDMGLREADISAVVGTGAGGRVTVEDLERFLDYLQDWPSSTASPMRLAVADAMRRSWTRPLANVGIPVLLDRVLDHRRAQSPKPGLTLYLLRAFALALAEQPKTAGYFIGEKIVHPRSFDIGVAVQVDDGVVVPTLRKVDQLPLKDLVAIYDDLVDRARRRRLTEADTKGGIATVTNFGTFGLTSGMPIPLPNETLILGIGAGVKKPVWSDQVEAFLPATEAGLFLTFDHRVVDGGGAGLLLKRVCELLQHPESL
ncbi:2-oxo acid dehydrogenase subunit E2 [Luteolibacter pohnpeiensis]|uniref:Dihydrolipoamide acetyltransferase component of pyruvate dehydrogenase complex n=1 Tax=Luteolibacter pohnpeiensis TaxID=454153 RepID=A0A934S552_9BACT|nr:dihydrolipoamide acetyltransferase family protein [Luteolibacter pohnpeiensis]MBK1880936.1 2-oxo acid dehydrogenase subunit E2 [Luteolibacter pohnpeiensis]